MASYDWHHPDYEANFDNFLEYLRKSVEILCTNYGPIGGFWFDGNWNKKQANWKLDELYGTIRKYQPETIIINNTGLKNRGKISDPQIDAVTVSVPAAQPIHTEVLSHDTKPHEWVKDA